MKKRIFLDTKSPEFKEALFNMPDKDLHELVVTGQNILLNRLLAIRNDVESNFPTSVNSLSLYYPDFKEHYTKLIENGYIEIDIKKKGNLKRCKKFSQKLLAYYFGNLRSQDGNRHWKEIETAFSECNLQQAFTNSQSLPPTGYNDLLNCLE